MDKKDNFEIYNDIATRTGGDLYIGVVGPVRTGKSTFIAKFMESVVLPNIKNKNVKKRAIDEFGQIDRLRRLHDRGSDGRQRRYAENGQYGMV